MNLRPFLLRRVLPRALLCVALVLNGAAPVTAHAQGDGPAAPAAAAPEAAAATPCASHHAAGSTAPVEHPVEHGPADMPAHDGGGCTDCCKSATCRCPCVQAGVSILPTASPPPLLSLSDAGAGIAPVALPAPALPHLIRPPIA